MLKVIFATTAALALAVLSGAHALSSASLRKDPSLSVAVFPFNGLAYDRLAYSAFVEGVTQTLSGNPEGTSQTPAEQADLLSEFESGAGDLNAFSISAARSARSALALEPLLPKAYVLLALSENDSGKRQQIIALASQLNRRELALQGLVLQQKAAGGDYAATITTLDQILRVHPERKEEFFPLLVDALAQKETTPAFASLLRNPLPWRDAFLVFAVGDQRSLDALAKLREDIDPDNLVFDQRLIAALVARGRVPQAVSVYNVVRSQDQKAIAAPWRADYPPLDWKLSDVAGLRAQPNKQMTELAFSIDPGNGGVLAAKTMPAPAAPFTIRLSGAIDPPSQSKDLKLKISCQGEATTFFEEVFTPGRAAFQIDAIPGCAYVELAIAGRSWTGSSALSGTLGALEISSK